MHLKLLLTAAVASVPVPITSIYIEGAEQSDDGDASPKVALMSLLPPEEGVTAQANGDGPVATTLSLPGNGNGNASPPAKDNDKPAITAIPSGTDPNPSITSQLGIYCKVGSNEGCGNDEFCLLALDATDGSSVSITRSSATNGVCTIKPKICNMMLDPVCGYDGQMHANECAAWSTGTSAEHRGECLRSEAEIANFNSEVVATEWSAVRYHNSTSGELGDVLENSSINVSFEDNGHFSGNAGCNFYSGMYNITSGSTISIDRPPSSTKMLCPDEDIDQQEQLYLQNFDGEIEWSVSEDGRELELTDADGDVLAQFASGSEPKLYAEAAAFDANETEPTADAALGNDSNDSDETDETESLGASSGAIPFGNAIAALGVIVLTGFI